MELVQRTAPLHGGRGRRSSCNTPPHCLGAVGRGTPATHRPTDWGQSAVGLLQYTASLPGGSGQCNSCKAEPHRLGAVQLLRHSASLHGGRRAVELLQRTAPLPGGSGQWDSCSTLPNRLGAVGSTTPAIHCRSAWRLWAVHFLRHSASLHGGQWAVQLLQHTAPLPGGSWR